MEMLRQDLRGLFGAKDPGMKYGRDLNILVRGPIGDPLDFSPSRA